jgi:hypothetical protein
LRNGDLRAQGIEYRNYKTPEENVSSFVKFTLAP